MFIANVQTSSLSPTHRPSFTWKRSNGALISKNKKFGLIRPTFQSRISLEKIFVSASSSISCEWLFHRKYVRKKLSLCGQKDFFCIKHKRKHLISHQGYVAKFGFIYQLFLQLINETNKIARLHNELKWAHHTIPNKDFAIYIGLRRDSSKLTQIS